MSASRKSYVFEEMQWCQSFSRKACLLEDVSLLAFGAFYHEIRYIVCVLELEANLSAS